ncbi:LacI family DNA-binding transcriptional regulator [Corynebacterium sp.]|uniref:LacI family DNA-binding transcriptional regulator n=1 Tax=Corynebacterium sp. TaxID=1720 RepID=UPI0026E0B2B8|nr:LacI family DNA-binding transcriptional regulator [Corynebacterium sp.]MDO5512862.1 LacI family DNA-binding transcriptional regulator [Corynebacterium sp.]
MTSRRQVSIVDVANAAGVSKSTVSRVLMEQTGVSDAVRAKVREAADELGYVRDFRAHSLKQKSINVVPILVRSVRLSFYGELVADIQHELERFGLRAAINTQEPFAAPERALERMLEFRPQGVIVASGQIPIPHLEKMVGDIPVVQIGRSSDSKVVSSFSDDNSGTSFLAREIRRLGHRHVALLSAPPGLSESLLQRGIAYEAAFAAEGIEVTRVLLDDAYHPDFDHLHRLLDAVSVIVCPNDPILMEVWETLSGWGLSVPQDVSLTGYDGIGQLSSPVLGITTWRQPLHEIAVAATAHLVTRLSDPSADVEHREFRGSYLRGHTLGSITL